MFVSNDNGTARLLLGKDLRGDAIHTQKLERPAFPAGAAYAVRTEVLRRERTIFVEPFRLVLMDPLHAIDIDEEVDLMLAELVAKRHGFTVIGG